MPVELDARALTTRTYLRGADGSLLNLDALLLGRNVEDGPGEFAQRMSLTLRNVQIEQAGGEWTIELAGLGCRIFHQGSRDGGASWEPLFEGEVNDWDYDPDTQVLGLVASDPLFAFTAHQDQVLYPEGVAGKDVIRDLFDAYGFPIADIAGPDAPLPRIVHDGTMGDLVMQVLQHGLYSGEQAYLPRWIPGGPVEDGTIAFGQVAVIAPGKNDPIFGFDARGGLLGARERQGTGEMVREVWLVGNQDAETDDGRPPIEQRITVPADDPRPKVGRRVLIKSGDYDSPETAKKAAETLLEEHREPDRTRTATVADVPGERKGNVVRLSGGTFDGYYTILSVSHDEDAKTMELIVGERGSALYQAQKFPDPPAPPGQLASLSGGGGQCMTVKMLAYAQQYLGDPYHYGGNGSSPGTPTDCSRFVQNAFASIGITIGRATGSQYPNMQRVPEGQMRAGDLAFYGSGGGPNEHVGLIMDSSGRMIDQSGGAGVSVGHYTRHGGLHGIYRVPGLAELNAANCTQQLAALSLGAGGSCSADGSGVTSRFGQPPADLASCIAAIFPPSEWRNAADVAYKESSWRRDARNGTAVPGFPNYVGPCGTRYTLPGGGGAQAEDSVGYFQINRCAHGGSVEELMTTSINVQKAFALWSRGGGYWGTTAKWHYSAIALGIR